MATGGRAAQVTHLIREFQQAERLALGGLGLIRRKRGY